VSSASVSPAIPVTAPLLSVTPTGAVLVPSYTFVSIPPIVGVAVTVSPFVEMLAVALLIVGATKL
jgi:hypothetical protein